LKLIVWSSQTHQLQVLDSRNPKDKLEMNDLYTKLEPNMYVCRGIPELRFKCIKVIFFLNFTQACNYWLHVCSTIMTMKGITLSPYQHHTLLCNFLFDSLPNVLNHESRNWASLKTMISRVLHRLDFYYVQNFTPFGNSTLIFG